MSPKGLSPKLIDKLRDTLLACGPFDSLPTLKAAFVDQRIRQWRDAIHFAPTSQGLVDMLISTLYEKADAAGQNGLLLFLRVLHDRTEVNDGCKQRLADLVRRVETELGSSTNYDRTSQAPSEKESTASSPPNHAATAQPGQGETVPPQLAPSRPAAYEKPKYPEPSQRLKNLGFERDPFAWPEAEQIDPPKELEEFFVAPPRFDEYILDLDRSAVLLAPRGGGKTACRLRLSTHLNLLQRDALSGISLPGQPAPFVVIYDDFEALLPALPGVRTSHHTAPLLHAVAEAMFKLLQNYSDHFLALPERRRQWWGQFLQAHLSPDMSLEERLDRLGNQALAAGLVGVSSASTSSAVSLKKRLTTFRETLQQDFGLDHIYILIDGVDGYAETKSPTDLAGLLSPLLDGLSLLSLNGIIWKFFLPDFLAETVKASAGAHTGRCHILSINWDKASLIELLQLRLQWASRGQIRELSQICEGEMDVSEKLARMSLSHSPGPPRALVNLARDLFAPIRDGLLSKTEWQQYLLEYETKGEEEVLNKDNPNPKRHIGDWLVDTLDLLRHNARNVLVERWEKRNLGKAVTPPVFSDLSMPRDALVYALPTEEILQYRLREYQDMNGMSILIDERYVTSLREQWKMAQDTAGRYRGKLAKPLSEKEKVELETLAEEYQAKANEAVTNLADIYAFLCSQ